MIDAAGRADRRLGAAVRRVARRTPGAESAASRTAVAMSPAFRVVVALLISSRRTRRTGLRALAAAVAAAMTARVLRDALGRPRPGPREEGGFPSRHAAASVAIAATVARDLPRAGTALAAAAGVGGLARVAHGDHEPADIAAGAVLGLLTGAVVARVAATVARRGRPG